MVRVKWSRFVLGVLFCLLAPMAAYADSEIAGIVTDATGAVLPGVTVEVTSPALIEQTRSVVSDAAGAYRIVDLRPGAYKVTFTLPGFNTFVRDGIVLESDFTATINAQMKVGGVEETITVSGASPVVDVSSTMSRTVLSQEQIEALPTGRSYQSLSATIPALSPAGSGRFDVGGASQMWQGTVVAYGSLANDTALEGRHERDDAPQSGVDCRRVPQSGRLPGDVVSGGGRHGRVPDGRRADQHDSEGRRQPFQR
jgi:Carboxypeptidase regulatory-like domain